MRVSTIARVATALLLLGCGGSETTSPIDVGNTPGLVSLVLVSPAQAVVGIGRNVQLAASTRDDRGRTIIGPAIAWSSDHPEIVYVSQGGLATMMSPGQATITATSEGTSGESHLTVVNIPVDSVTLTPTSEQMYPGQFATLTATLFDSTGNALSNRIVEWSSSAPDVAGVSAQGVVNAVAPGNAVIRARSEGVSATATIQVLATPAGSLTLNTVSAVLELPGTTQLVGTVRDGSGNVLNGRTITWSSNDQSVATVSASGLVTAVKFGTAVISASSGGATAAATITVAPASPLAITVTANASTIVAGQSTQAMAVLRDANGNTIPGADISWSSANGGIATVSSSGLVTGVGAGTVAISASAQGGAIVGSTNITVSPVPVASVSVTPATATVLVGDNVAFAAVPRDANGNALSGRAVTWQSGNTNVATVSSTGVVTGVAGGTVTISATSETRVGTAQVIVTVPAPPGVNNVVVTATATSILTGQTTTLTAIPRDASNNPLAGRTCSWTSNDAGVAPVLPATATTATVTGRAAGVAVITATCDGIAGTIGLSVAIAPVASVTITPSTLALNVGQTSALQVNVLDGSGQPLTGRLVAWTSSNSAVATVSATGVVTALSAGSTIIQASSGGQIGFSNVTVSLTPVRSVTVAPSAPTLIVGQSLAMTATTYDALGNVLTGRAVSWTTSDAGVASVSAGGVVTGVAAGQATIRATSEGMLGVSQVTVTIVPVNSVTVSPTSASIIVGQTTQLTATTRDVNNNVLTGRLCTWSTNALAVASVSPTGGLVQGIGPGTATITATCEGRSASATISVSPVPVALVSVSPQTFTLSIGATRALTATTRDANNTILTGRTITWSSSNAAVASVSGSGVVTGLTAGTATIRATSEGVTGTSSATITVAPVAAVSVTPSTNAIDVGATVQLTASMRDASGNVLSGRTVSWSSSDNAIASVSASGLVSGVAAGTVTITATSEGVNGTASVVVGGGTGGGGSGPVIASVTVTPASASLNPGGTQQLAAQARDGNGTLVLGATISWSTSNAAIATVNQSGLVTAIAAGSATITATADTRSGTSAITVTNPAPGSCSAPNIRGPLTFDDGTIPNQSASNGWYLYADTTGRIIVDPTANGGRSYQMSYHYAPGSDQGSAIWDVFTASPQRKVYARMRYKQDPTFDNSGIKKLIRFQGPNGLVGSLIILWGRFSISADALSDGNNLYVNVGSEAGFYPDNMKGGWHTIELMADLTGTNPHYQLWIDGQLKMDHTVPRPTNGATIYLNHFGGTFNSPGATTKDWMDDLATSTSCIGTN